MEACVRKIQEWARPRPWAVRVYAVVGLVVLPSLLVVAAYQELAEDAGTFIKEATTAFRTGRLP